MADEIQGLKPFSPENLPNPSNQVPIEKELSAPLVPGSDEFVTMIERGDVDNLLTELHSKVNGPEGYTPDIELTSLYAEHVMKTVYPVTPNSPDKSAELLYAEVLTKNIQRINEEMESGKTSPEIGSLEVRLEMERMRRSYEGYLRSAVYMDLSSRIGPDLAEEGSKPERLLGPEIEMSFVHRTFDGKQPTDTDKALMKLLSHYRSFRLAEEMAKAAHEKRPVDKDLVDKIWEASNVRRAIVKELGNKQEAKEPQVEPTPTNPAK